MKCAALRSLRDATANLSKVVVAHFKFQPAAPISYREAKFLEHFGIFFRAWKVNKRRKGQPEIIKTLKHLKVSEKCVTRL